MHLMARIFLTKKISLLIIAGVITVSFGLGFTLSNNSQLASAAPPIPPPETCEECFEFEILKAQECRAAGFPEIICGVIGSQATSTCEILCNPQEPQQCAACHLEAITLLEECFQLTRDPEICFDELDRFLDACNVQCRIPPTTTVEIDIKPGSDPNSVNCNSKGVVPFAILSDENFDATTIPIEIVSMSLVSSGPIQVNEVHNQLHLEDVNGDGLLDGVLHINIQDICLFIPEGTPIRSTIQITLTGETTDGEAFEGSDNIVLKGKKILEN